MNTLRQILQQIEEEELYCQYYLFCENTATGVTTHPVLGYVPTCQRCADKHELTLITDADA